MHTQPPTHEINTSCPSKNSSERSFPSEAKSRIFWIILAIFLSIATLWLCRDSFISAQKITLSFHQKTTAPVHFALWYKTSDKEDFTRERLIVKKNAPQESDVIFDLPISHLHQFRLDFPPVEDANITLSDLRVCTNTTTHSFSDLSTLEFNVPKDAALTKNGNSAKWRCSRPVSKISPLKPIDLTAERKIDAGNLAIMTLLSISIYYLLLILVNKIIYSRHKIIKFYQHRVQQNAASSFLPHLEGLRGIAIILILLFHLGSTSISSPITLTGGYLGVEIFLVLSGFLLALGFCRKHESLLFFTRKKLLRIMFPTSVLVLLTICAGIFCMDNEDLHNLGNNALYALLGVCNIQLSADGAEYFATDQAFNPLLHMWYIAITLQLYLLLYLGYLLIWPFPKWAKILLLLTLASLSFVYGNCHTMRADLVSYLNLPLWMSEQGSMYYSTLARLWEPILGIGILLLPYSSNNKHLSTILCGIAILAILLCVWHLPDHAMLITACSTAVLIRYGNNGYTAYLFNNKVLRFIGKISFSIYLIHMPLFVYYKYVHYSALSFVSATILLLAAIGLGFGFWWSIEKRKMPAWGLLIIWLSGMLASLILAKTNGLRDYLNNSTQLIFPRYAQFRYRSDNELSTHYNDNNIPYYRGPAIMSKLGENNPNNVQPFAQIGEDTKKPSFVLIGDSHAYMSYAGLDVICKEAGLSGIQMHTLMLPVWNRNYGYEKSAYAINRKKIESFIDWLKKHKEIRQVVVIFSWVRIIHDFNEDWNGTPLQLSIEDNLQCVRSFLLELKKIGRRVIIFTPYPRFEANDVPRYAKMRYRAKVRSNDYLKPYVVTPENYENMWSNITSAQKAFEKENLCHLIDAAPYFFRNGDCYAVEGNKLLYMDCHHFSAEVSIELAKFIKQQLIPLLNEGASTSSLP